MSDISEFDLRARARDAAETRNQAWRAELVQRRTALRIKHWSALAEQLQAKLGVVVDLDDSTTFVFHDPMSPDLGAVVPQVTVDGLRFSVHHEKGYLLASPDPGVPWCEIESLADLGDLLAGAQP